MFVAKKGNKTFWSGSVSLIDGVIEEIHTYKEAEMSDFHHSLYFSETQIEKMDNGECAFFCVDRNTGEIYTFRQYGDVPNSIIRKIKEQITIRKEEIAIA